jgi:hypothetical protein
VQGDERQPGEPEHGQRDHEQQRQEEEPGHCAAVAVHALPNAAHTSVEDRADGTEDSMQCVWSAIQIGEATSRVPTRRVSDVRGVEAFSLSQEGAGDAARARAKRASVAPATHSWCNPATGEDEQYEGAGVEKLELGAREIGVSMLWIEELGDAEVFLEAIGVATTREDGASQVREQQFCSTPGIFEVHDKYDVRSGIKVGVRA